jgi:hypothetical protein
MITTETIRKIVKGNYELGSWLDGVVIKNRKARIQIRICESGNPSEKTIAEYRQNQKYVFGRRLGMTEKSFDMWRDGHVMVLEYYVPTPCKDGVLDIYLKDYNFIQ